MRFQIGSAYLMGLLLCSSGTSGATLLDFTAEVPGTGTGKYASVSAAITAAEEKSLTTTATITLMGDMTEGTTSTLSDLTAITLKDGRVSPPKALVLQGDPTISDIRLFSKTTGGLTGNLHLTLDNVTLKGFKSSTPGGAIYYMGKQGSTLTCAPTNRITLNPRTPQPQQLVIQTLLVLVTHRPILL